MLTLSAPSVLSALPRPHRDIAAFEDAFNARRRGLESAAAAQLIASRITQLCRRAARILVDVDTFALRSESTDTTMCWITGEPHVSYRTQPRDGRGRFLSKAWLARAEAYQPGEVAWFRSPLAGGK